jgi:hypothetical protein
MLRAWLAMLALAFAAGALAQPSTPAAVKKEKAKPAAVKRDARPAWAELTAEQQLVLAPLKNDWDALDRERRLKWVQIAKRYPRMKALEQERVQRRMQIWANLSPEQRRQARENYKRLAKAPRRDQKTLQQAWSEYQALAPRERENFVPPAADTRQHSH